jgi:hypothetical protein
MIFLNKFIEMKYVIIVIVSLITLLSKAQYRPGLAPSIININGKYGLVDEQGKSLVLPENDTIISSIKGYLSIEAQQINPIFFIKRNNKFAYAYYVNMDNTCDPSDYPKEKIRWYVSEFLYERIEEVHPSIEHYNVTYENGFILQPYQVLKYRLNGKWGFIYMESKNGMAITTFEQSSYPAYLGISKLTAPKCDYIGDLHEDGLYDVKINGKWALWQVIAVPSNAGYHDGKPIYHKWVDHLYPEYFDSPPISIGYEYKYSGGFYPYYRIAKKEGKWGAIKINEDTTQLSYIAPCNCDTVSETEYEEQFKKRDIVFLCKQKKQNKVALYYDSNVLEIDLKGKPPESRIGALRVVDTIPNGKMEDHLKYVKISLGIYDNNLKKTIEKGYCIVDLRRRKSFFFVDDTSTTHDLYYGYHSILVQKQVKTALGIQYEFYDLETGIQKLVMKARIGSQYRISSKAMYRPSMSDSDMPEDYLLIMELTSNQDFKYKYSYDFRTKKFRKGRCKGCRW